MDIIKKPSLIFARSKSQKNAQYSVIEQQTGTALHEIVAQLDGENKRYGQFLEINKVV